MKFHRSVLLSDPRCWEWGPAGPQAALPGVGGTSPGGPTPDLPAARVGVPCLRLSSLASAQRSEALRVPLGPAVALRLALTSGVAGQEANR